jgi:hypothetical protein
MAYAIIGGLFRCDPADPPLLPAPHVAWFRIKELHKEPEVGLGAAVPAVAK